MKDFSEIILPVLQNSFIVGGKKHNYTSFRYAILSYYPSFIWEGEESLVLIYPEAQMFARQDTYIQPNISH